MPRRSRAHWGRKGGAGLISILIALAIYGRSLLRHEAGPANHPGHEEPGANAAAPELEARAQKVQDGDTLTLTDGVRVRLLGVDAPESGRPFAEEAREAVESWTRERVLRLRTVGASPKDGYGRLLALVTAVEPGAEIHLNEELLRRGLARVYHDAPDALPAADLDRLLGAQREALRDARGIWKAILSRLPPPEGLVATRLRIHLRRCPELAGTPPPPALRDLRGALEAGKSPCRTCNPLD